VPRKSWISPGSWQPVRKVTPLRRALRAAVLRLRGARLFFAFCAWWFCCRAAAECDVVQVRGVESSLSSARRCEAASRHAVDLLQSASRRGIRDEKREYVERLAVSAAVHAEAGRTKDVWKIIKQISGKVASNLEDVRLEDSAMAPSKAAAAQRWQQYFVKHFSGTEVADVKEGLPQQPLFPTACPDVVPSIDAIIDMIDAMPTGKSAGPDGLPIEAWRAAGPEAKMELAILIREVICYAYFPVAWSGGRLVPYYRGVRRPCYL